MAAKKEILIFSALGALAVLLIIFFNFSESPILRYRPLKLSLEIDSGVLMQGDLLHDRLVGDMLTETQVFPILKTFGETFNMRSCKAGDRYEIARNKNKDFVYFKYWTDPLDYYLIQKETQAYTVKKESISVKKIIMGASGNIETSLWEAMISKGVPPEVAVSLTDIFAWQIDFLTEPRKGDSFMIIWERSIGENGFVKDGKIISALYRGEEVGPQAAILFNNHYYDSDGRSLQKQFLKAPLNYRRISSFFTYHRFHPILKISRPHLGIDYVAPKGTPIVSIGEGTVISKGYMGGNGNLLIIRHNSIYSSTYGHLSGFARGLRVGSRVAQGQLIGYVGSTGLSTGPHLDFRVKKYSQPINFLKLKLDPLKNIEKKEMPEFEQTKKESLRVLSLAKSKDGKARQIK